MQLLKNIANQLVFSYIHAVHKEEEMLELLFYFYFLLCYTQSPKSCHTPSKVVWKNG